MDKFQVREAVSKKVLAEYKKPKKKNTGKILT